MKLTDQVSDLNARTRAFRDVTALTGAVAYDVTKLDGIPTRATGNILFALNPSAAATITLNGTAWTFVASGATGNQTNIAGSLAATLTQLAIDLNASVAAQVSKCVYTVDATYLYAKYKNGDSTANSFTLAASVATVSGANLTGGLDYGGATTKGVLCPVVMSDLLSYYRLRSGTDATSSPTIIRPWDYDGTNHQRVWELLQLSPGELPGATPSFSMYPATHFS